MIHRRRSASVRPWVWWGLAAPFAILAVVVPAFLLLHAAGAALLGLAIVVALAGLQYPIFRLLCGRPTHGDGTPDRDPIESP